MTHLLNDQAAYVASENRNLSTSVDIAANTALIPKFQPHLGNLGNSSGSFLLANQNFSNGSYPSSMVMGRSLAMDFPSQVDNSQRYSNSVHWLYSNQNPCSSSNPLNNGASSSQTCQCKHFNSVLIFVSFMRRRFALSYWLEECVLMFIYSDKILLIKTKN